MEFNFFKLVMCFIVVQVMEHVCSVLNMSGSEKMKTNTTLHLDECSKRVGECQASGDDWHGHATVLEVSTLPSKKVYGVTFQVDKFNVIEAVA